LKDGIKREGSVMATVEEQFLQSSNHLRIIGKLGTVESLVPDRFRWNPEIVPQKYDEILIQICKMNSQDVFSLPTRIDWLKSILRQTLDLFWGKSFIPE
jgi:hypothetical protein